jgi:hypothetical protein
MNECEGIESVAMGESAHGTHRCAMDARLGHLEPIHTIRVVGANRVRVLVRQVLPQWFVIDIVVAEAL